MYDYSTITEIIHLWMERTGDTYISSWINTVLYGCSFLTAIYRWRGLRQIQAARGEQFFWLFLILVLFALGVNKQFDFQTMILEAGRRIARYENWYEKRRLVQAMFSYAFLGTVVLFTLIMLIRVSTREFWRRNALASIGFGMLCVYVVIRTTSAGHVGFVADSRGRGEFRLTDIIELLGILCIFVNTLIFDRRDGVVASNTIKNTRKFLWGILVLICVGVIAFLISPYRSYVETLGTEGYSFMETRSFAIGSWRPGIGDPSFMGWFTVYSYYFTALVCFVRLYTPQAREQRQELTFWLSICFSMAVLGVIKQFNLLVAVDQVFRIIAQSGAWTEERRIVQALVMGVVAIIFFLAILRFLKIPVIASHKIATAGFAYLLLFVIFRGISLHQFETLLGYRILGARVNWIAELLGIYWVCGAGILFFVPVAPSPRPVEASVKRGTIDDAPGGVSESENAIESVPENAIESVPENAIESISENAETHLDRADACEKRGDYGEMLKESGKAVELDPESARAYVNRGLAQAMLGNYEQSIEDFRIAARLGHEEAQEALRKQEIDW